MAKVSELEFEIESQNAHLKNLQAAQQAQLERLKQDNEKTHEELREQIASLEAANRVLAQENEELAIER